MNPELKRLVEARLEQAPLPDEAGVLILEALQGGPALDAALGAETPRAALPVAGAEADAAPARGAFLRSIAVEGFRGIGAKAALPLEAGPGLTLVVGRNGSGKSSFAEGLELLLTGDSKRWENRSSVWRDGWRNLHHAPTRLETELVVEGEKGPCTAWREWADGTDLGDATAGAQRHGQPKGGLDALGWTGALQTYRPFLSYNELGSALEERPSDLYDRLSSILGLEDLAEAQKLLGDARRSREKALKEAKDAAKALVARLGELADERAAKAAALLEKREWDFGALDALLDAGGAAGDDESQVAVLRRIAGLDVPTADTLDALARDLREAARQVEETRGTLAARSRDLAGLLDAALHFHESHGDGACPVCGRADALSPDWSEAKRAEIESLRDAARAADESHRQARAARAAWEQLPLQWDPAFAGVGLETAAALAALKTWTEGSALTEPEPLAGHVEAAAPALLEALGAFRDAGKAELERRQDLWRPLARELAGWRDRAAEAGRRAAKVKHLKDAETWLKDAAAGIRDERFAPIAERADAVWRALRQQSHVELGKISLTGSGTRRKVSLDVTVDGAEGAALGVMSQGELHSLALSLFIPRATLDESPFRFVVIDDPVQSMDPARVDGLAEVLQAAARTRQVVVFTHDDRLPQAVRRLGIAARVLEVTRRDGSHVECRPGLDPVERPIQDALAVARTSELPDKVKSRIVPGLCRLAVEAACQEAVRRRRLGRGEPHAAVEELLEGEKLKPLTALALFDDGGRAGDVLGRLNKEGGRSTGDLLQTLDRGAHQGTDGPLEDLVRGSEKLAGWLRGMK